MLDPGLRVAVYTLGDVTIVAVNGELDVAGAPQLRQRILGALNRRPAGLVVDLAEMSFLDCAGLSALLFGRRRAELLDVPFALSGLTSGPAKLLRLTDTIRLFTIHLTLDAALTHRTGMNDTAVVVRPTLIGGSDGDQDDEIRRELQSGPEAACR